MSDYRNSHLGTQRGILYDQRYREGAEYFYWKYFEKPYLVALFAQLGHQYPGHFLDFATGTGRILEIASPFFDEVFGVDVSENMVVEAKRKLSNATFVLADVTVDPPKIGPFPVVSLFRFILNSERRLSKDVLMWLRSVIAEEGVLVLNNHCNKWSATGLLGQLRNAIYCQKKVNVLSDADVGNLLQECGFRIETKWGFCFIPSWRNRLLLPEVVIKYLEQTIGKVKGVQAFAKDRIYFCRPV